MASFGKKSRSRRDTCDPRIQILVNWLVEVFDISIIFGHRDKPEQDRAFKRRLSKLQWPKSTHNSKPSMGIDIAPYDKRFGALFGGKKQLEEIAKHIKGRHSDETKLQMANQFVREQYTLMAGLLLARARDCGIGLRWGGDWNSDFDTLDNNFDDLGHFEVVAFKE